MENRTKVIGATGISILILIAMGINYLPDDTHYCEDLKITKKCDHLSLTNKTCYPNTDNSIGKKYCSTDWILINRNINKSNAEVDEKNLSNEKTYILCEKKKGFMQECVELNSDKIVYKYN